MFCHNTDTWTSRKREKVLSFFSFFYIIVVAHATIMQTGAI